MGRHRPVRTVRLEIDSDTGEVAGRSDSQLIDAMVGYALGTAVGDLTADTWGLGNLVAVCSSSP